MYNYIFYFLIGIIIIGFIFSKFLDYLNLRHILPDLPSEVSDVYNNEEYKKSQEYKKTNIRFSFITGSFNLLLILIMLISGGFGLVNNFSYSIFSDSISVALLFFGILWLASDLINTPFAIYDTFVIEEKFGFNKTRPLTFTLDKLKGWILGGIIGGALLSMVIWFFQKTGSSFWLLAWAGISIFMILMTMFYSQLIVPIFNKQTPLEDGPLKDQIKLISERSGFKLDNIFVIDGSKRSTKSNAYFTGLGSKKRIVLYDTLIQDLTIEEITAVLAHEIGHYKKKHTLTGTLLGILQTGFTLFIFSLLLNNPALATALNVKEPNFHISLISFGILYSPVSFITGIFTGMLSRHNEFEADKFASDLTGGDDLISALKKLTTKNLSNLTPHPLYVFFHYSHPTLVQRIRAIKSL